MTDAKVITGLKVVFGDGVEFNFRMPERQNVDGHNSVISMEGIERSMLLIRGHK